MDRALSSNWPVGRVLPERQGCRPVPQRAEISLKKVCFFPIRLVPRLLFSLVYGRL